MVKRRPSKAVLLPAVRGADALPAAHMDSAQMDFAYTDTDASRCGL